MRKNPTGPSSHITPEIYHDLYKAVKEGLDIEPIRLSFSISVRNTVFAVAAIKEQQNEDFQDFVKRKLRMAYPSVYKLRYGDEERQKESQTAQTNVTREDILTLSKNITDLTNALKIVSANLNSVIKDALDKYFNS